MTQVVLIRPGATVFDEQHRVQGVLDVPLCERGVHEAKELAGRLVGITLSALYCGPGVSVEQTAEIVGKKLGLRPKTLDDLRNLDQGLWQGLQIEEIKRRYQKVFRQWVDDPATICPPNGETWDHARLRLCNALKPLIKRHRDESFGLIVAEPCASLVRAYLTQSLEKTDGIVPEEPVTGAFERIDVAPELCRNGKYLS